MVFLKFFSFKTKLILSLVFVLIIAIIFSVNYFVPVSADNFLVTENFTTDTLKDANATTGIWDTTLNQARLLGKDWINMEETKDTYGPFTTLTDSVLNYNITYDTSANPYIVWVSNGVGGVGDVYFTKWTPGTGWTGMDCISAYDNISSSTALSSQPKIKLDGADDPIIIWSESSTSTDIYLAHWDSGNNRWANMAGNASAPENISQDSVNNTFFTLEVDGTGKPAIVFTRNVGPTINDLYFTTWNGTTWTGADGVDTDFNPLIYENDKISDSSTSYGNENIKLRFNSLNEPYIAWWQIIVSPTRVLFTKWTPAVGWTHMDGTTLGFEPISDLTKVGSQPNLEMGTDDFPYITYVEAPVGGGPSSNLEILFAHWTGSGWYGMDGIVLRDNVSINTSSSQVPQMKLDAGNNPIVIWRDTTPPGGGAVTQLEVYLRKWTGVAWTAMDGIATYDNISNTPAARSYTYNLAVDSTGEPNLFWGDGPSSLLNYYFTRWVVGSGWEKIDGTLGQDAVLSGAAINSFSVGPDDTPYVLFADPPSTGQPQLIKGKDIYASTSDIVSLNMNTGSDFVVSAKISAAETLNGQTVNYFLSNDGGATWEVVSNNVAHDFITSHGFDLRWKAELVTILNSVTPVVDDLDITYRTKKIFCSLSPTSVLQGQPVTIAATTSFVPGAVWATVEKNGEVLSTVTMNNVGGNNFSVNYSTAGTNLGRNDVAVFASNATDTYVCNPSTGVDWQRMSTNDIPWDPRTFHGSVSLGNYIYLFGGLSDRFLSDVWRSQDGYNWQQMPDAPWAARGMFDPIVFNDKIWVMGGRSYVYLSSPVNYGDVWYSSDGQSWTQSTNDLPSSPAVTRRTYASTVFNNKLWISGGNSGGPTNDVWYNDDPITNAWVQATPAASWSVRTLHQMVTFDNKMWVMGGNGPLNDIWHSTDGVNWYDTFCQGGVDDGQACVIGGDCDSSSCLSETAAWPARVDFQALVFDEDGSGPQPEKMWVMGGADFLAEGRTNYNDVWSSVDGSTWILRSNPLWTASYPLNSAPATWEMWSARNGLQVVKHNNGAGDKLYLLGGYEYRAASQNDVWISSDGSNWDILNTSYNAPFSPRFNTKIIDFKPALGTDQLWLLGGKTRSGGLANDIWSTADGRTWSLKVDNGITPWSARFGHNVFTFDNKLWILGGCANDKERADPNTQPQPGAYCLGKCDGGTNNGAYCNVATDCNSFKCKWQGLNDIWNSNDGENWTCVVGSGCPNPVAWAGRYGQTVATYNGKIYLIGGITRGACLGAPVLGSACTGNAQCVAGGGTQCAGVCLSGTNAGNPCLNDAACGGNKCSNYANVFNRDVLSSSNGYTWTQEIASAPWPLRYNSSAISFNDGYAEKLYFFGGYYVGPIYYNDVWWTTDGATWRNTFCQGGIYEGKACIIAGDCGTGICAAKTAEWPGRMTFALQKYNDKLWVYSGQTLGDIPGPGTQLLPALWTNDVWWSNNGSFWTQANNTAEFPGRDYFTSAVFDNRLFLTGGDSNWGTMNDVWASSYDYSSMNFTVSSAPGSTGSSCTDTVPEDPGDVVAPSLPCVATSSAAIDWDFVDNAACEMGYRLYDAATDVRIKYVEQPNLSLISETGLDVNNQYSRYVTAYNAAGESAATTAASCFTLAKVPNKPIILSANENEIILQIDPNDGNPVGTEYEIKELLTNQFVQADGTFGAGETWQTYDNWGGDSGLAVIGELPAAEQPLYEEPYQQPDLNNNENINAAFHISLTSGQNYNFTVQAKNGDGIPTGFSATTSATTVTTGPGTVLAPNVGAEKGVFKKITWHSSFGLFNVALASNKLLINASGPISHVLAVLSWLLNLTLLILLVMLGLSLYQTLKYLKHEIKYPDTFRLIWSILSREAQHSYKSDALRTADGVYYISAFGQHKKLQNLSQQTFKGTLAAMGIKLIILGTLFTGLITVNHSSLALLQPYNLGGETLKVGDVLTYDLEVSNKGTAPAQNIVIKDTLSNYLTFRNGTSGLNFDVNTNTVTFTLPSMQVNGLANFIINVVVKKGSEGKVIINQAQVSGDNFMTVSTNIVRNEVEPAVLSLCGNNKIDPGEQCDPTGCASDERCVSCRCQPIPPAPVCGNSIVETGEQCDNTACGADQICSNCACLPVAIPPVIPPIPPVIPPPVTPPGTLPPGTPPGTLPPSTPPGIPLITPIISSISGVIDQIVSEQLKEFMDNSQVEQTSQNVVTPILLGLALLNTVPLILALSIYLLPYLHLLFLEPLLILFGKKRKKWGVVYNSLSKVPVDLALVRLYRKNDNMLVQTRVTDKEGRYIIIAKEPGKYYLSVTKPGFTSPTKYLKDEKQDLKYLDLYHGEMLEITEKDAVITANIPLDPAEKMALPLKEVLRSYLLKNLRLIISYVGIILALLIVIIYPTVITIGALILHVILFLIFRRLIVPAKPKRWGIVYDAENKAPLHQAVVRIFDTKFNKLLETQVTDRKGRYAFLWEKMNTSC